MAKKQVTPPEKLTTRTADMVEKNLVAIGELFPNCVTEGRDENGNPCRKINFDALRQELSTSLIEGPAERYQLDWPGKRQALLTANTPITKTLRPRCKESVNFEITKNLFIEGDNLDALKLLQAPYLGKVKMIYIDPPYNTGNDFIYKDRYATDKQKYLAASEQIDDNGNQLIANPESNGRFHSDWLSMLYPRLKLARNLLRDDGVIFVSIDDNEAANLKRLCDDVFGEQNFVACIVWQKKYGPANDSTTISPTHDYIVCYAKNIENWEMGLFPRNEGQIKAFRNPDNDSRGLWRASDLSARSYSASCDYEIIGKNGTVFRPPQSRSWIVSETRYKELLADNRITFDTNGNGRPMQKTFLSEVRDGITPETWWSRDFADDNKVARYEMKELIEENIFDTPKPVKLIQRLMKVTNAGNDGVYLDFFAGSGTTAHDVMQLNAEDGGNRRFILVQLPEKCADDSEAAKAGYATIAEIGKERIRRAGMKILGGECHEAWSRDIGFRVLSVDSSNLRDVYYVPDELQQSDIVDLVSNVKEGRTEEDLIFQVMLDLGLDLSLPVVLDEASFGRAVFVVGSGELVGYFGEGLDAAFVKKLAKLKPQRVVFRDASFATDAEKVDAVHIFQQLSPDTEVKVV